MTGNAEDVIMDTAREEFLCRNAIYKELACEVEAILKGLLKSEKLKAVNVISRVKDVDGFLEKIHRKKYDRPFEQMTDIVGTRVVCLYTEDQNKIGKMIDSVFKVLDIDDKVLELGIDRMGYHDISYVAILKDEQSNLNKYKFEIQVRTIMADAVSIIAHDLSYKKEPPLPKELEREVNLIFSTMELVQYHCDALRNRREKYVVDITNMADDEKNQMLFFNEPITDDSLRVYTKKLHPDLPIKENIHSLILRDLNPSRYRVLGDIDKAVKAAKEFIEHYKRKSESFKAGSDYISKSLGYCD
ncbi:MAG: hypothetical protein Q8P24_01370, partial [Desulfobacterales bacterium]|nr:hypothetical protein [Desulfobacterales bacterium]